MSKSRFPGGLITSAPVAPTNTSANGVFDGREQFQYSATSSGIAQWPGEDYEISRSLRFRSSASAYLTKTFGTPTNNKIWTWSMWVKRGYLSAPNAHTLFLASSIDISANPTNYMRLVFEADDTLTLQSTGSAGELFASSSVYRDCSAWYHIILSMDATNTIVKCFVNGVEIKYASRTNPSNSNTSVNASGNFHRISLFRTAEPRCFDGYMAEVNFVDGQALDPSYFGYTDQSTNIWMPKAYSGVYGNNGFYLPFNDPTSTTTIGYDRQLGLTDSSKNNWTATNISITAGVTYDSMVDVPVNAFTTATDIGGVVRGNYATLNPLAKGAQFPSLAEGNLRTGDTSIGNYHQSVGSTIAVSTGKWYWEIALNGTTYNSRSVGIFDSNDAVAGGTNNAMWSTATDVKNFRAIELTTSTTVRPCRAVAGTITTATSITLPSTLTGSNVFMVAMDIGAGAIWFGLDGVWLKSATTAEIIAGTTTNAVYADISAPTNPWMPAVYNYLGAASGYGWIANFGQRPFAYTPPTGYKSLNTTNLQAQGITSVGLAGLQANKHFEATVYTGIDKRQSINNAGGFQPDFIWAKSLTNAYAHNLIDSVRGRQGILQTQSSAVELTSPALNDLVSFDSNGFTVGPSNQASTTGNGGRTVAYQWKGGGAAVSNTSGTITSSVSANVNAGFSVVSFNSTSATGTTATVGHGLGAVPSMIIMKNRGQLYNWEIYHISSTSTSGRLIFTTSAKLTDSNPWNQPTQAVTSSIFGYNQTWNGAANDNIVAYCWAAVPGYSAFGSYTGNVNADGPFVYTGFRPRWLMLKRNSTASVTYGWQLYDTSRSPYNTSSFSGLWADTAAADTASTYSIDLLSNGFKLKDANINMNASGDTYVYAAFAETPFALNNRAR